MARHKARYSASDGGIAPKSVNGGWWTHRYARDFCALSVGVAIGWWVTTSFIPTAPHPSTISQRAPNPAVNPHPAADAGTSQPDLVLQFPSAQEPKPAASSSGENEFVQNDTRLEAFIELINKRKYSDALEVYIEVETFYPEDLAIFRSTLLDQLKMYLASNNSNAFTGLSDAVLQAYYSDIEVLVLVADFHAKQNELGEALTVFQLAKSYAEGVGKGQLVQERLSRFVEHTVSYLSNKGRWAQVQMFLEDLLDRDLATPKQQILLAEIYFHNGFPDIAKTLLAKHRNTPGVSNKVARLYAAHEKGEKITPEITGFDAIVNLAQHGAHYLVPLRLGGQVDVNLLLDTGASITTVSPEKLQTLHNRTRVRYKGRRHFNTANGITSASTYEVEEIRIGPYTLNNVEVAEMTLSNDVDGLLGMNILGHIHFQLDQVQGDLLLTPRD